ncbi:MAG TPA: cation:dicarboxylase symporter family transporter, partial [Cystobacter sp.]
MKQHQKMLLGIVIGTVAGIAANLLVGGAPWLEWVVTNITSLVGQLFLRLLLMLVVPLLFAALVTGVCELDLRSIGRLGLRTLGYTVVISSIAVLIGLFLVNTLKPGTRLSEEAIAALVQKGSVVKAAPAPSADSVPALILSMVPTNPIETAAKGDMIALIVFSLIFGIGLMVTDTPGARHLKDTIQGLYDVLMTLIDGVLRLAPVGVGALLFSVTARLGFGILVQVASFVGVVLLALGLHMFVVYSLSVRFLGGRNPITFFRDCRLAIVTAFST